MNDISANTEAQGRGLVLAPTASSVYEFGWKRMKQYFLDLFLIVLIVGAVLVPLGMINSLDGHATPGGVLLRVLSFGYWFLLFVPIDFGAAWIFLRSVRGEKFEVKDMFTTFEDNYVNVVLANLLQSAMIWFGLVLFVVPGIIIACRLAFVRYLVVDRKMDAVAAVKGSWEMTRGHAGSIFATGLLAFPILVVGAICFGVGIIPAVIWIRSAFASMYFAVSQGSAATTPETAAEGPAASA